MTDATRRAWNVAYQEALEYDTWGQVEEAVSCYNKLQVAALLESNENKLGLAGTRRAAISQLAAALKLRIQELNSSSAVRTPGLGLTGMKALSPFVSGLIVSDMQLPPAVSMALKSATAADANSSIPINPSQQQRLLQGPLSRRSRHNEPFGSDDFITATIEQQDSADLNTAERGRQQPAQQQGSMAGMLRPPPQDVQPDDVTLSVSFGSWSAKGAEDMCQPHVHLTVRDKRGKLLEAVQESPQVTASRSGSDDKLDLDFVWHLQTPLNCMAEDAAVFMELRHWKADKKKMSVKCYAVLPYAEMLRPGAAMLELYRKPVDYKRRGQHPSYTSKPMYVHVVRTLTTH